MFQEIIFGGLFFESSVKVSNNTLYVCPVCPRCQGTAQIMLTLPILMLKTLSVNLLRSWVGCHPAIQSLMAWGKFRKLLLPILTKYIVVVVRGKLFSTSSSFCYVAWWRNMGTKCFEPFKSRAKSLKKDLDVIFS